LLNLVNEDGAWLFQPFLELRPVPFPTAPLHIVFVRLQAGIVWQAHLLKAGKRHPKPTFKFGDPLLSLRKLVFQFLNVAFHAQLDDVLPHLSG
jgi:hypothetical protein